MNSRPLEEINVGVACWFARNSTIQRGVQKKLAFMYAISPFYSKRLKLGLGLGYK